MISCGYEIKRNRSAHLVAQHDTKVGPVCRNTGPRHHIRTSDAPIVVQCWGDDSDRRSVSNEEGDNNGEGSHFGGQWRGYRTTKEWELERKLTAVEKKVEYIRKTLIKCVNQFRLYV
jgi:hypothetical protein